LIYGIGVDLVRLDRLQRVLERQGTRFLERVFTSEEVAYSQQHKLSLPRLAAIFAAKEAVLKSLGTGWSCGIKWKEVQIVLTKNHAPGVHLEGVAARIAHQRGVGHILLSLSHDTDYAIAYALALKASSG